jgi:hypothetical protein
MYRACNPGMGRAPVQGKSVPAMWQTIILRSYRNMKGR